jgi:hypothetical protein
MIVIGPTGKNPSVSQVNSRRLREVGLKAIWFPFLDYDFRNFKGSQPF